MNVIAHNLMAMNADRQFRINEKNKAKSGEKLSSGYKINRASDDAAGLSISEKMRKQIKGLNRGTENMEDGVSWLQIGDGAMAEVHSILHRMNELAIEGANGVLSKSDREAIDAEVQQLKTEINRINETAKFNDMRIFSDDDQEPDEIGTAVIKRLEGVPADFKIFNASYDDATGDVSYGGLVIDGSRVAWDEIDSGMVYLDGNVQKFHAGTWVYLSGQDKMITISAKEGDEVPRIMRTFDITADRDGLLIDGELVRWKDIKNQTGISVEDADYYNEKWTANFHGAKLTFEIKNSYKGLQGMIEAINTSHDSGRFKVYAAYSGSGEVQAVDADINSFRLQLSNDTARMIAAGKSYILRADADGLWLQDGDGNDISGSKKMWGDMGIGSWDQGMDISSSITYRYSDKDGTNDTNIEFTYSLSDITSRDSVIDGLDGVLLSFDNVVSKYETSIVLDRAYSNIRDVKLKQKTILHIREEVRLGRDFDNSSQTFDQVAGNGKLESVGGSVVRLSYADNTGNDVVGYVASTAGMQAAMENDLMGYEDSVISFKIIQMLAGIPGNLDLGPKDLRDLLGADKVSDSGKMTDAVTLNASMEMTNGSRYRTVAVGEEYPCGFIDFSGAGTDYEIWELIGSGFDSTCGTCDQHYNFNFVFDTAAGKKTQDGFRYNVKKGYPDASLEISVSSLVENGVRTGEELASAIMKIVSGNFDYHYQQYAREGSKLYIHERPERQWSDWYGPATFQSTPHNAESQNEYTLNLGSASNGSQNLTFTYDCGGYWDQVQVEMAPDNSGQYVRSATGGYELYDAGLHAPGTQRYNIQVSYADAPNGSANSAQTGTKTLSVGGTAMTVSTVGDCGSARGAYVQRAVSDMVNATTLELRALDYTRADMRGDENENIAIDSLFEAYNVEMPVPGRMNHIKWEESIQIQKSGDVPNALIIPRFSLNAATLGLSNAGCLTEGACRNTIDRLNYALDSVSARRSLYGALQNSLEHAISSNENTEENTVSAESHIRDTDMAEEMVIFLKNSILEKAGQAIVAQANQNQQSVLSLLQG